MTKKVGTDALGTSLNYIEGSGIHRFIYLLGRFTFM